MTRIAILVVVTIVAIFVATSIKNVGRDEVVLVGSGKDVRQLEPGVNFILPFKNIRRFKLKQVHNLRGDASLDVQAGAGKRAKVEAELEFDLAREKIRELDRSYGENIFEKIVRPTLLVELAASLAKHPDPSDAALEPLSGEIADRVNVRLKPLGVTISSLVFKDIRGGEALSSKVERQEGVKLFVLGLDGYDWIIMDRVTESVDLSNIKKVRREGAWGDLQSIEPLVSPLIWTTMVTGVTPDIHGITDFLVRDETTGQDIPVTSSMRRVPAVWNMTPLADLSCGFIGWFASFPAENVNGFIVSDRFGYHMFDPGWREGKKRSPEAGLTYPADLYDEIASLSFGLGDVDRQMARYIQGPIEPYDNEPGRSGARTHRGPPDPESSLRQVISAYLTYESVMKKLYPLYRPDLFGVYFEFTDSVCHLFMRCMKPAMEGVSPEEAKRYGRAIAATYAEADRILGDVLNLLEEDTVLLVVSDHGFKSGDFRPLSDSRMGFGQAIEWHRINGSIALYGSIVKPGYEITNASVMDIAPTILYLLGMPVDSKMSGKVLLEALDPEWVANHPVTYTSVYDSLAAPVEVAVGPSGSDRALKDKLVSLGYVAGGQMALINLANYYHKNGKYEEALGVYKQILEEEPDNTDVKLGMANAYLKMGKIDIGIRTFEEILAKEPNNLKVLHSLANFYVETGDGAKGLATAERALQIDPSNGESHFIRGISLQALGRYQDAIESFRRALKLAPDMPEIYANLAMLYVNSGRSQEALELVERALDLSPGKAEMLYIRGLALAGAGRNAEALEQFMAVIESDPSFVPVYLGAAGVFFARGEFDSVLALCDRALAAGPGYAGHVHEMKANAYVRLGRYGTAIDEFKSAIEAAPDMPGPRLNLARTYISQGKTMEARRELRDLLSRHPDYPEARRLLQSLGPG